MAAISGAACSSSVAAAPAGPRASLVSSPARKLFLGSPVRVAAASAQKGSYRFAPLPVRAATSTEEVTTTTTEETGVQTEELINDLKAKWDSIENKTNVFIYAGGALVAIWLSSTIVGAVNSVPLLPKILELVGLGYTGWFVYRYLLFKESRKELGKDIDDLKAKITGSGKE